MPRCSYDCTSNKFAVAVSCFPLKVVHTFTKTFPEISISALPPLPHRIEIWILQPLETIGVFYWFSLAEFSVVSVLTRRSLDII